MIRSLSGESRQGVLSAMEVCGGNDAATSDCSFRQRIQVSYGRGSTVDSGGWGGLESAGPASGRLNRMVVPLPGML